MKRFLGTAVLVLIGIVAWNIYKELKEEENDIVAPSPEPEDNTVAPEVMEAKGPTVS